MVLEREGRGNGRVRKAIGGGRGKEVIERQKRIWERKGGLGRRGKIKDMEGEKIKG